MLKNIKLAAKFNLLLLLVFLCGTLISGAALSGVLQQRAQNEVSSKALILIDAMKSVRDYTSNHVNPLLSSRLETEPVFIPETVPSFSATEVFANFRKNEEYKSFSYKEATLNPTNLRDQADSFETKIVERFRNEPKTKEISDFRSLPAGEVFYVARPLAIKQASCLRCHSTPEAAPKSQLVTYGAENGFNWQLNEIVTAQIISVPADEVFESSRRSLSLVMAIITSIFAILILVINFLLKRTVIQPIKRMARVAQAVSTGDLDSNFEQKSNDEIGTLAAAFNRMKSSLEIAMKLLGQKGN